MSEILEEKDVAQEVVTPDQEDSQSEPGTVSQAEVKPEENIQDKNWRAARSKMDEQSHQIYMLQQELQLLRNYQPQKVQESEEDEFLTDSERKLNQKIKSLESMIKKNQVKDQDQVIDILRGKFKDFDEAMNPENIAYLKQNSPALAKAIASLKDDQFEQGLAAYDALKNTEWFKNRHTMQDKEKIDQNAKKPMSVQAVRKQGALSDVNRFVNGLTPDLKKSLQKEMAEARKRA